MSCQNGTWKKTSSGTFGGVYLASLIKGKIGCKMKNPVTNGCSCPSGTTAITVNREKTTGGNDNEGWDAQTITTSSVVCVDAE